MCLDLIPARHSANDIDTMVRFQLLTRHSANDTDTAVSLELVLIPATYDGPVSLIKPAIYSVHNTDTIVRLHLVTIPDTLREQD